MSTTWTIVLVVGVAAFALGVVVLAVLGYGVVGHVRRCREAVSGAGPNVAAQVAELTAGREES